MGKTLDNKSMEEDSKLHNNSVEEEKRLQSQFVAISKLCTSDIKSFSMPWNTPTDEVDGEEQRTVSVGVLKRLISRIETDKNPMNIIPTTGEAQMAREGERNKLYEVLDTMQTDREDLISYTEFKTFVQEAQDDSR